MKANAMPVIFLATRCTLGAHCCKVLNYSEHGLGLTHLFCMDSHCSKFTTFFMNPATYDLSNLGGLVLIRPNLSDQHSTLALHVVLSLSAHATFGHASEPG